MAIRNRRARAMADDPLWYKDAIIYELHVRAFHDQNGDGIGDFPGLVQKLDYLQDLGVTAIWLLPFYPSPLKDDGYDIAEYTQVNPSYGTLRDFKHFLAEAHARGLRVITELVLNHTSDQHPWFQRARRAPRGSRWRDFYVWSDDDQQYKDARIIFQDFERSNWTWDPVAGQHFWHRFYHHQPDLNFDNPAVKRALKRVVDFWMEMGVDGLRLDAVPYLYEREGTNCENLGETHAFLKELRAHVDARHKDRMLLAEANQWPEDAVTYFGDGDECHMNFHFPLMPRLWMALRMEDRFPIVDIIKQTPEIPGGCQWALFLRNHDELTLEMVTDQERDYMWRVYAHDARARINLGIRRRLAPLLGNDRRKIELMNGLLFSLPGTPVVYYGDELGMGDNIWLGDRNGVRTPMQWSSDRNAGFSRAHPQSLFLPVVIDPENHYETVNVETQQKNPSSLLWWTKRLIALRKRYKAFGRGSLELVYPDNPKVLAFLRRHEEETLLVVANLSRFTQAASIDLSRFTGTIPVELFGRTVLPPVEEGRPYFLTLGGHAFHWFALEPRSVHEAAVTLEPPSGRVPLLRAESRWAALLAGDARGRLEQELPAFIRQRRWFGAKTSAIRGARVVDAIPLGSAACLLLVQVEYFERDTDTYAVPLALVRGDPAAALLADRPGLVFARVRPPGASEDAGDALIVDGLVDPAAAEALVSAILRRATLKGEQGRVLAAPAGRRLRVPEDGIPQATLVGAEQSNTSAVFGRRWVLKVFRTLDEGVNPDLEVGRFLSARRFEHAARVEGELTYLRQGGPRTLGVLAAFVPNEGDAWRFTLDALGRYYERVLAQGPDVGPPARAPHMLEQAIAEHDGCPPSDMTFLELTGVYPGMSRLLGDRTARLHLALASDPDDPAFAPEPYPAHAQRSIMQGLRTAITRTYEVLRRQLARLPAATRAEAEEVLTLEGRLHDRVRELLGLRLTARRIRTHGDLHLGQVLYTGGDFVFIDFEGEPSRPISERRMKRSALRDVAGVLRSMHYAAHAGLEAETIRPEDRERLRPWADAWFHAMGAALLCEYLKVAAGAPFLPAARTELRLLLDLHLLEKALYELVYELDHRPAWVRLPFEGIRSIALG
ncbi:MAG: maltose alpha-D-glucosyltransferase [Planctomycetes bacterium]|nr:maltose alpha-D-glucosyltransferase [Planctomycetota bacterium]